MGRQVMIMAFFRAVRALPVVVLVAWVIRRLSRYCSESCLGIVRGFYCIGLNMVVKGLFSELSGYFQGSLLRDWCILQRRVGKYPGGLVA